MRPKALPGEFVSDQLRADCTRFLDEVRTTIDRRQEAAEHSGWVPRSGRPPR